MRRKIKKSQILILGSFLVFVGVLFIFSNDLLRIKEEVFNDMNILILGKNNDVSEEIIEEVPEVDNVVDESLNNDVVVEDNSNIVKEEPKEEVIDYNKYYGVLEIPRIGLKRGFYNVDSKYNDIEYNVAMVRGSKMPDVDKGNLILMAHSGDAYISYFAYLYKLSIGDYAYVTYNGNQYKYQIVNIYDVPKNGTVSIVRNYDKTTLTLITCTKDNDYSQTVYIAELV